MTYPEIRPRAEQYEAYVEAHKKDGMPFTDYDTWYKHELECEKQVKVEKRKKPTMTEQAKDMRLKGELVSVKNRNYDILADIIWDKRKKYLTWNERRHALDEAINVMRRKIWETIEESGLE